MKYLLIIVLFCIACQSQPPQPGDIRRGMKQDSVEAEQNMVQPPMNEADVIRMLN